MHDLGTFGETNSEGFGINDAGQITGYGYTSGDSEFHAFLYDGTMHDLGTLGGTISGGLSINNAGQITGSSYTSGDIEQHAFFYDGTMHDLGTLGGPDSQGRSINSSGQITGFSSVSPSGTLRAFLYTDGVMVDLSSLISPSSGWVLVEGNGINDGGQITGRGTIDGQTHAFLLTPVIPEPSGIVLAALGLASLILLPRRRRG